MTPRRQRMIFVGVLLSGVSVAAVLVFLSAGYLESPNCRREVLAAVRHARAALTLVAPKDRRPRADSTYMPPGQAVL
mgnify:CR=1 FL=1